MVPTVPVILRAKGWNRAAWFQTVWLNGPANEVVGHAKNGIGTTGPLRVVPIEMKWILTFARARDLLHKVTNAELFTKEPGRRSIIEGINKRFDAEGASRVAFGNLSAVGAALEDEYTNYRTVDAYKSYRLDELTAALGRFSFYVIPSGFAVQTGRSVSVRIDRLGVYVRDSFDFEGPQFLGIWQAPNNVAAIAPIGGNYIESLRVYPRCSDLAFEMTNDAYRMFRRRTGYGEDFLIYSDVHTETLPATLWLDYVR